MSADGPWGVADLAVTYGDRIALDGVTATAHRGRILAVVGGDGAGKTTLLRVLAGAVVPHRGRVDVPERGRIGVLPERGGVFADLTVAENVAFARSVYGADRQRSDELLRRTELGAFGDRLAGRLSGGMRQKLAFVMAVQHRPDLILLDEATTGLDPVSSTELWRLLGDELGRGSAVVLSTTYLDEAARADDILVLEAGRAVVHGKPGAISRDVPGVVRRADRPLGPHAWRRGGKWHTWLPEPGGVAAVVPPPPGPDVREAPDLEDAVIIAALRAEGSTS